MKQNTQTKDDALDLQTLLFSLFAQWKLIAFCIAVMVMIASIYLRITPATYVSDAMVQVEDSKGAASAALLGQLKEISGGMGQKSPAEAEMEILKSRLVLGQVIQHLNLNIYIQDTQNSLFDRLLHPPIKKTTYDATEISFQNNQQQLIIQHYQIPNRFLNKTLKLKFLDHNGFSLSDDNTVVFTGKLNQLNTLSNPLGQWSIKLNKQGSSDQAMMLTKYAMPTAIQIFRSHYNITEKGKATGVLQLSYSGTDKIHITHVLNQVLRIYSQQNIERKTLESKQTLAFLDKQLPELKQQLLDAEIKFNQFREKNNTVDITQESELLLRQNIELAKVKIELKQKQAELKAKYTDDHPLMTEIDAQLASINTKTQELNQVLKRLPELQRHYLQLYRDVKLNTELYTSLLNSYQQLKVSKAGEIGSIRVIDTAIEPVDAVKPIKWVVLLLAVLLGSFVGLVIALFRSLMNTGIKDANQIEHGLDLPVYATIPRSAIQEGRIHLLKKKKAIPILAVRNHEDIAIESLRSIRTTIHFALSNAKNNVISISGPSPEVGKSFISVNLAVIFAQSNKKVLLIDADLRRGYLHRYFNRDAKSGLADYISKEMDLSECIHQSNISNLDFMSRGRSSHTPSEMLASEQFKNMLEKLQPLYDHIIIDTPPILAVTDGIIIAQYAGVNLIVARFAKTQIKEMELTLNRFEQATAKINGVILNDIQHILGASSSYKYVYAYQSQSPD